MKTPEVLRRFENIALQCQARIRGIGADQYAQEGEHRFAGMTPQEILDYAREELFDLINYGVFTIIRIEQLQERLTKSEGEHYLKGHRAGYAKAQEAEFEKGFADGYEKGYDKAIAVLQRQGLIDAAQEPQGTQGPVG